MKPIDIAGFEQKFRDTIDPWNYSNSPFEFYKRRVLLQACGCRTYGRGLELACAIGETTRYLSPRCLRLLAIDSSETALREAARRTMDCRGVTLRRAVLPGQTPRGPFDLIVASEIAYYLSPQALDVLLRRLYLALAPGGRIVFLHHSLSFNDAAQLPAIAQARIRRRFHKTMQTVFHERHARFEALAFRKRRR
jgi:cyclopropane fatty-acyl-phospholipid synthase-like methyltransferase